MTATPTPELAASLKLPDQSLSRSCFEALQTKLDQLQLEMDGLQSNYGELQSKYCDLQSRHEAVLVESTDVKWGELEALLEPERRVMVDEGGHPALEPVLATVKRLTLEPFDKLPEVMISHIMAFDVMHPT